MAGRFLEVQGHKFLFLADGSAPGMTNQARFTFKVFMTAMIAFQTVDKVMGDWIITQDFGAFLAKLGAGVLVLLPVFAFVLYFERKKLHADSDYAWHLHGNVGDQLVFSELATPVVTETALHVHIPAGTMTLTSEDIERTAVDEDKLIIHLTPVQGLPSQTLTLRRRSQSLKGRRELSDQIRNLNREASEPVERVRPPLFRDVYTMDDRAKFGMSVLPPLLLLLPVLGERLFLRPDGLGSPLFDPMIGWMSGMIWVVTLAVLWLYPRDLRNARLKQAAKLGVTLPEGG